MKIWIIVAITTFVVLGQIALSQNAEWYLLEPTKNPILSQTVFSIAVDKSNIVYFSTIGFGVIKYNWEKWSRFNTVNSKIPSDDVSHIFFDRYQNLWCATGNGIGKFDGVNWTTYYYTNTIIKDDVIYAFCIDSNDGIWCSNYDGLYYFDKINWIKLDHNITNIIGASPASIVADKNNNIWFGSFLYGLVRYNGISWDSIWEDQFEPRVNSGLYKVKYMVLDYNGSLWLTPNQGLAKLEGEKFRLWDYERAGFPSNTVFCISADRENNIWIGTDSGLVKYDGVTFTTYNRDNSPLPSNNIHAIAIDSTGHKWISCYLPWLGETRIAIFREGGTIYTDVEESNNPISDFSIYPNPAGDYLDISNIKESVNYQIFSMEGILQLEGTTFGRVNISEFYSGLYYIKIKNSILKFAKL